MYYHSRPLQYVEYGKVFPPPEAKVDSDFLKAYKWLGKHCGYCPQIWLSRSKSQMTGYKYSAKYSKEEHVMFAFENIVGFPLEYEEWCYWLGGLLNTGDITSGLKEKVRSFESENKESFIRDWGEDLYNYEKERVEFYQKHGETEYLKKFLFIEKDQVVVPSLNLKSAKKIYCKNEKVAKKLRQMGFIKDRIEMLK